LGHALCWLRGRLLQAAADAADNETDEADETVRAAADAAAEPSEEQSEQLERLQAERPHAERRHERVERRHEHAERWFKEARTARLAAEEVLRTANEVLVAKLSEAAAGAAGCRMSVVDCGIPGSASLPVTWKLSRKLSHSTKGKTCGMKCPKRRPKKLLRASSTSSAISPRRRAAPSSPLRSLEPYMLALATFAAAALRPSASPQHFSRRAAAAIAGLGPMLLPSRGARALEETVRMPGLNGPGKSKTFFSDFELSATGLQFKDYKLGAGAAPKVGDKVSLEWTGVTVGYQGRYFETRNKPKGGAFADDGFLQEPLAFTVGGGTVIPAIDEAVRGMALGGIRRIIVPEEIGYPADGWKSVGPKPSTFSGQRALDFVLASKDSMMDKTLMFDLKLTSVRPAGVR